MIELLTSACQFCFYVYGVVGASSAILVTLGATASLLSYSAHVAYALVAACDDGLRRLLRRWWLVLPLMALVLATALFAGRWDLPIMPAAGTKTLYWANIAAAMVVYWLLNTGFIYASGMEQIGEGFQRDSPLKLVNASIVTKRFLIGLVVATVAAKLPGPFDSLGVLVAVLASGYTILSAARSIAILRRGYAPWAEDRSAAYTGGAIRLLHLSDVHVTRPGAPRTEGGVGGNERLRSVIQKFGAASRPEYVLVTGDLVDRGDEAEWEAASESLRRLQDLGSRILVAPGNHDLATAYNPELARHYLSQSTARARIADPYRLIRYLEFAAAIEPELRCWAGRSVDTIVRDEKARIQGLEAFWQSSVDAALAELRKLGLAPGQKRAAPRHIELLRRLDPAGERILAELAHRAAEFLLPPEKHSDPGTLRLLRRLLVGSPVCRLAPETLFLRWSRLWTELFPLRLAPNGAAVEFLILNSARPEPGLLGSAYGAMGKAQINRLSEAVRRTKAGHLIVMMHHSVCRWRGKPSEETRSLRVPVERWAMLGYHTEEGRDIVKLLEADPPDGCRRVLLCTGHRHASASAGPWVRIDEEDAPAAPRLWLLESAALPELSTSERGAAKANDVIVCVEDASGLLVPQRVDLASL